jgi:hypothetical protein
MVHFDFTVDDVDAENIFDCITDAIGKAQNNAYLITGEYNEAEREWWRGHIKYLQGLKEKMKNTSVAK